MSASLPADPTENFGPRSLGSRRLSTGITATWWYTVAALLIFQLMILLLWIGAQNNLGKSPASVLTMAIGGLAWCVATVPLLVLYRRRDETVGVAAQWRNILLPLCVSVAFAVSAGLISGLWVMAVLPIVQSLMLLNWPRGVRLRLVIAALVLLGGLWFIDLRSVTSADGKVAESWWALGFLTILLPAITVSSLWWWDVLATLDRARAAESRLGATQERLRVATDVHDLQGHHLQVIALQLELSERLLTRDPEAALKQLRLARSSVAEAQQGTRDLAMRFRGVPLRDEVDNAVDILRAAGISVHATVSEEVNLAPANILGPIIRETTTNVLRHGAGLRAHLSLEREGAQWRYEITNDRAAENAHSVDGSGLQGIIRRAAEADGSVEVHRGKHDFSIVVLVPATSIKEER
ncbi:histidine kinase [Arthrobacter sp. MYb213]|uniref:sensor histidine kinase n=1 Tax=Arthrobacter sp. MYb213 TaxID=1848595 RepID=UPI000CFD1F90|nr:histidine kinase [Arthrobacter sp. MYb213]PRB69277.1 sensor histidine kinase [Arthrobacter sp. MYb213]